MSKRVIISGLPDPFFCTLVTSDVKDHSAIPFNTPFRLTPDFDVELDVPVDSGQCVHAQRVIQKDNSMITVRCRDKGTKKAPNGFLCGYHQQGLNPKDIVRVKQPPYIKKVVVKNEVVDLYQLLPELRAEVKAARSECSDAEIHDHASFERLKGVQLDPKAVLKYLSR